MTLIVLSIILSVLAGVCGAFIFYAGVQYGARFQEAARRGMQPPSLIAKPVKIEVSGDDEPGVEVRIKQAMVEEFKSELSALKPDDLQSKAEFFNVAWDERAEKRDDVIEAIVTSRFNPGVFRA